MIYCCSCFVLRMPRFLTMCMLWRTSKAWWGFNIHIWTLIIFDTFCKCLKIHNTLLDLSWSAFQALCTYWEGSALCISGAASSQNEWSPCHLNRGTTYILHAHTALVYMIAGFPSVTVCTCKIYAAPLFRYHGECMSPGKDAPNINCSPPGKCRHNAWFFSVCNEVGKYMYCRDYSQNASRILNVHMSVKTFT